MIRRFALLFLALAFVAGGISVLSLATAQEDETAERGALQRFVEDRISTPDRQIRLGAITGALSSDVGISTITIADSEGVWLTVHDARMVWSRLALLRGRLTIDSLTASSIEMTRPPVSGAKAAATPASREPFSIPELPVEVSIGKLEVPSVVLEPPVLGERATLSVNGRVALAGGSLDTSLVVERTDANPGKMELTAKFAGDTRQLDVDLQLDEPANGVMATVLGIPGRPAVHFSAKGSGPLDSFSADVGLDVAGERLVSGTVALSGEEGGTRFVADLGGTLGPLFPPEYAAWVSGRSTLLIDALRGEDGTLTIRSADLDSGVADFVLSGTLAPDFFPTDLKIEGRLADPSGQPVVLPRAAGAASVGTANFTLDFGGADEHWTGRFDITALTTPALTAEGVTIDAGGDARNLRDPSRRDINFDLTGALSGVDALDPDLDAALGDRFDVHSSGHWAAGQPVAVEIAEIKNPNAAVHFAGSITGLTLDGRTWLNAADIAPFGGLAGRPLAGALTFESQGSVALGTGAFDLSFDASGENLAVGIAAVDPLLTGASTLEGHVARTTGGLSFDGLSVRSDHADARIDGRYDLGDADLAIAAAIADIATLTDRASGRVSFDATVKGHGVRPAIVATVVAPSLDLSGHKLTEGRIGFDGTLDGETSAINGAVTLAGFLDKVAITGGTRIESLEDGGHRLAGLLFDAPGTRLSGDLTLAGSGLASGSLQVNATDLSAVAPLLLVDVAGALNADVELSSEGDRQQAAVVATGKRLRFGDTSIGDLSADVTVADLYGVPMANGKIAASALKSGSLVAQTLTANARHEAGTTHFDLGAKLDAGRLEAAGALTAAAGGYDVALNSFSLTQSARLAAVLRAPVTVSVRNGTVNVPRAELSVGSGRITVSGSAGERLNLSLDIAALPLAIADAVRPDFGVNGTLSATAHVTGTPAAPVADLKANVTGFSLAAGRAAGVPAVDMDATGRLAGQRLQIDATARGGGLTLKANGSVPLGAGPLDLRASGGIPLALADRFLRDRGGRVTGTARLDLVIGGTLSAPRITGTIATNDAGLTDPESSTRISGLTARVRLEGERAVIESFSGSLGRRGRIEMSGTVGTVPSARFPADLTVTLKNARLTDNQIVSADVDATLRVTGPLAGGPKLSGEVRVARAEITVPETMPSGAVFLDVTHRLPPPNVERTLERVRAATAVTSTASGRGSSELTLDLSVVAPARIFVRGRGIDAELGGRVQVTGPLSDVRPIGAFELIRGRVTVVGQRINFDRGSVTLVGDLDPALDFTATTRAKNITVTAQISGVASNPKIALTSVPELPQDEVLAQLLFGHSVSELSPLQLASLAMAVTELAGAGGGGGVLDKIRQSTGLDDLEIVTDAKGNAAVQAGRYVTENVYLGVRADQNGDANVTVNLDLGEGFRARAEVGAESGSTIGVFYETEY